MVDLPGPNQLAAMIDLLLTEIADRRPAASRGLERHQVVLATELVERASS